MIQQAVRLAIALSATAGPWGWLNAAAAGVAMVAAIASVPEYRAWVGR
ncbi:MAG: hypothetical protein IPL34_20510 [Thiofilum sp.]|nr:hypothetical protein [Thiofilum sp.]